MKTALSLLLGVLVAGESIAGQDLSGLLERIRVAEEGYKSAFSDMTVTQKVIMFNADGSPGAEGTATTYVKGDKMRLDMDVAAGGDEPSFISANIVTIIDGETVHMKIPIAGWKSFPPESEEARRSQGQKDWHALINERVKVAGNEKVDGIDCVILQLDPALYGEDSKLWLDRERLVALKMEITAGGNRMESRYSDYRKVAGGFLYPYSMTGSMNGKTTSRMTVVSLKTDTGVDDALFVPGRGGMGTACGGCCLLGIKETVKSVVEMIFDGL